MPNTIETIEQKFWGNPPADSTNLVTRCYVLRKKELNEFTNEDYRILIGQNIALEILIPSALNILRKDILAEGDLYEGDLRKSVLTSETAYWQKHTELRQVVIELFTTNLSYLNAFDTTEEIREGIKESFEAFKEL